MDDSFRCSRNHWIVEALWWDSESLADSCRRCHLHVWKRSSSLPRRIWLKGECGRSLLKVVTGATIVCGQCKMVTEDWTKYREHKKRDCVKQRDEMEPACLVCTMCNEPFTSAWKAIFHLTDFHRMKLFYPDYSKGRSRRSCS